MKIIVQNLKSEIHSDFEMAYKYFVIMSELNDLGLVKRDIQLLAYAASEKKPISDIKEEFVEKFGTSIATVGNIISKLYKKRVLVKNKRLVEIIPVLLLEFERDIFLKIHLKHEH
jgi:DNA-binding MarR family transcriptional regulator